MNKERELPSIFSSPLCREKHPRHGWRCTREEGHPGPHSVLVEVSWEEPR